MPANLVNLNGNLLCSIDTETTGLEAGYHDIIQIAIIPLDNNLDPNKLVMPFIMDIKPKRPENATKEAMRVNKRNLADIIINGIEPFKAADMFEEWFLKLQLSYGKKIAPLGQNYQFDQGFIKDWLGIETYNQFFDYHYRDTMLTAQFLNDRATFHNEKPPFAKVNLTYLASSLDIDNTGAHDAVKDTLMVAQIYRRMMNITMAS